MSGINSVINGSALGPILDFSVQQSFRQIPVPNTQTALYTLTIRTPGLAAAPFSVYTFPMSPQAIKKTPSFMTSIYDVAGSAAQKGVQRQADIYGEAPPVFTIEGTTGWQRHSNDGYLYTGQQSIELLQLLLDEYATINQQQMQAGINQLYTLEFYDYFSREFWQVEPVGPQGYVQDAGQPLYTRYQFTFAGITKVSAPIFSSISDPIGQLFQATIGPIIGNITKTISNTLAEYTGL